MNREVRDKNNLTFLQKYITLRTRTNVQNEKIQSHSDSIGGNYGK